MNHTYLIFVVEVKRPEFNLGLEPLQRLHLRRRHVIRFQQSLAFPFPCFASNALGVRLYSKKFVHKTVLPVRRPVEQV